MATLLPDGQVLAAGGAPASGPLLASAELYVQPTAGLAASLSSGSFRQSLVITGTQFAPGETVNVYADVTTTAPLYTATAGTDGSFVLTSTVKQGAYGSHTLIALGQSSALFGATAFFVTPRLLITPTSGSVGSPITASGYGFGAGEKVKVYWANPVTFEGTATANSAGTFAGATALTFTIPAGAPPGIDTVAGIGQTTKATGVGRITVH